MWNSGRRGLQEARATGDSPETVSALLIIAHLSTEQLIISVIAKEAQVFKAQIM